MSTLLRTIRAAGYRSFALALGTCLLIVGLGAYFSMRGQTLLAEELRERLRSTAATAAQLIDPVEVVAIRGADSMDRPELAHLVAQLNTIRSTMSNARFAYIMRRTDDPHTLEFVADADTLATEAELDENGNGVVDPDEEGSYPGDPYDIAEIPALLGPAFEGPAVDDAFTVDQWGTVLSGYAPIRNAKGETIAVLGIDITADDFLSLTRRVFSPIAFFALALSALIVGWIILGESARRRLNALHLIEQERSGLLQLALHRIGTPLTIFKWALESLDDCMSGRKECPVEMIKHEMEQLRSGTQIIDETLQRLMEAEKVEIGSVPNRPRPVPIQDIITEAVENVQKEVDHKQQAVRITAAPCTLSVDPKLIEGVIQELLRNASNYSLEKGVITVDVKCTRRKLTISVIDHGCGVPPADLPRLFQKFRRGSNAHLSNPDGSGIGLFVARSIIERAGGKIWMESELGKGTTVTFTLPRR